MDLGLSISIRHLTADDLPALEWEGEYTHFRRQFELVYSDYCKGTAVPWVAVHRESGEMIGQVFVLLSSRHRLELADGSLRAYLYSIRVKPRFRGLGLGGRLMDIVEADLVERGYGFATLNVARGNANAQRFYARRGFRIVAPEPGQWSYLDHLGGRRFVDEPAWRMEKKLEAV